jgi:ribulose-5-phosphate 4-epimerase/fuculose-1-phosphate aldolase
MTAEAAEKIVVPSLKGKVRPEEWKTRVELAACYRLVAHEGWSNGIGTHLAARVPGDTDQFLINPVGVMFHEITASSLIMIDYDGKKRSDSPYRVNRGGIAIHGAVFMKRPDIVASLHTHTEAGMAISALDIGLLPINPLAMRFHKRLAFHDYYGQAGEFDDQERIGNDLGPHYAMIMKNHGLLAVGRSMGEAFIGMAALESAINTQLRVLSTGVKVVMPPAEVCDRAAEQRAGMNSIKYYDEGWRARMRFADQLDPSYRN